MHDYVIIVFVYNLLQNGGMPAGRLIREWEHICRNMVSVGVFRMGKTNMIFIDPGTKVNSSYHFLFVLGMGLSPDIQARCRQHKWTFQQDGVLAHTRNTTDNLKKEKIDFIEPDMWPPNSPDINPVDYAVWRALQQRVYHRRKFNTVEELKRAITTEWKNCHNVLLTIALNEWRR